MAKNEKKMETNWKLSKQKDCDFPTSISTSVLLVQKVGVHPHCTGAVHVALLQCGSHSECEQRFKEVQAYTRASQMYID